MVAFIFFNGLNQNVRTAIAILILMVCQSSHVILLVWVGGWKRFTSIDFYPAFVCTFIIAFCCLHFLTFTVCFLKLQVLYFILLQFNLYHATCMNTVFSFQKWRSFEYGASWIFCAFLKWFETDILSLLT